MARWRSDGRRERPKTIRAPAGVTAPSICTCVACTDGCPQRRLRQWDPAKTVVVVVLGYLNSPAGTRPLGVLGECCILPLQSSRL